MKCVVPTQIGWKKVAFFVAAFLQAMVGALTLVFHEEIFGSLLNSVSRTWRRQSLQAFQPNAAGVLFYSCVA